VSYALFGPAFTIEADQGSIANSIRETNEAKVWQGKKYVEVASDKDFQFNDDWQAFEDPKLGPCTKSNHKMCLKTFRQAALQVACPRLQFSFIVFGTPPNVADFYGGLLQLTFSDGTVLKQEVGSVSDPKEMKQLQNPLPLNVLLQLDIPEERRGQAAEVKAVISAKDVEHWGGNYGTVVCQEAVFYEDK